MVLGVDYRVAKESPKTSYTCLIGLREGVLQARLIILYLPIKACLGGAPSSDHTCCRRVLPEGKEWKLPEPETGRTSLRYMATPPPQVRHEIGEDRGRNITPAHTPCVPEGIW
ncbi:hypothetical protein TNCV_5040111 [Trichonephila clavipes]|nr:hypothetical protein TNCV_5040111 [Trichonephila clavipes]